MANRAEKLRKAYEFKLGNSLVDKLSDEQIALISKYYNSLSEDDQSQIDNYIFMGKVNDLSEMARGFIEESKNSPVATATKESSNIKPPTGALVTVEKKDEDLVEEKIDERILRILGLEDTFDIDYGTYKSLLKEQSVLISTGKSKLPREEEMIIQDEFKRIRGKDNTLKFKIKKKTISTDSFFGKNVKDSGAIVKYQQPDLGLSTSKIKPTPQNIVGDNSEILDRIEKLIREIQNNLTNEEKLDKSLSEKERRKKEKGEKSKKESKLESFKSNVASTFKKVLAPVQGIFDRILNTFKLLFFGWALDKLFKFIRNPENVKTVDAVFDFLGRNIGKLVLLYFLLNSPFIKITRWLTKSLFKFLIRMAADLVKGKGILKGIRAGKLLKGGGGLLQGARAVATNPVVLGTAAIAGTAILANEVTGQREAASLQADRKAKQDRGKVIPVQGVGGVGDMGAPSPTGSLQGVDIGSDKRQNFEEGGEVSGPKGIDKVKANLTDGEFVVSAPAVKKIGVENLMAMNAMGGGDNKPKMKNGEMNAAGGGLVLSTSGGGLTPLSAPVKFSQLRQHHGTGDSVRAFGITKDYIMDGPNYPNYKVPTPVDAVVKYAGAGGGYGNMVQLVDSNGKNLGLFGHFSRLSVKTGDKIKAGTSLGIQGTTGRSTAPHVHLEGSKRFHEVWSDFVLGKKSNLNADSLSGDEGTPAGEDQTKDNETTNDLVLSPEDAKMANAYLQYITQPQGRGLDILPTIDRVSAASSPPPPQINPAPRVPSGSATNPNNPQQIAAAAKRQLTGATR